MKFEAVVGILIVLFQLVLSPVACLDAEVAAQMAERDCHKDLHVRLGESVPPHLLQQYLLCVSTLTTVYKAI